MEPSRSPVTGVPCQKEDDKREKEGGRRGHEEAKDAKDDMKRTPLHGSSLLGSFAKCLRFPRGGRRCKTVKDMKEEKEENITQDEEEAGALTSASALADPTLVEEEEGKITPMPSSHVAASVRFHELFAMSGEDEQQEKRTWINNEKLMSEEDCSVVGTTEKKLDSPPPVSAGDDPCNEEELFAGDNDSHPRMAMMMMFLGDVSIQEEQGKEEEKEYREDGEDEDFVVTRTIVVTPLLEEILQEIGGSVLVRKTVLVVCSVSISEKDFACFHEFHLIMEWDELHHPSEVAFSLASGSRATLQNEPDDEPARLMTRLSTIVREGLAAAFQWAFVVLERFCMQWKSRKKDDYYTWWQGFEA